MAAQDNVYPTINGTAKQAVDSLASTEAATQLIFNEIKTFCNDYEAAGYLHLTPPQSPPTSPLLFTTTTGNNNQPTQHQFTEPQLQLSTEANICYDVSSMASSHSVVDLQLQSNDCLDKTFMHQTETPAAAMGTAQAVDPDLVELIDELLRNKTKDVHENYVLISTQLDQQPVIAPQQPNNNHNSCEESMDYCDDNVTQYSTPSYGNSLASSPSRSGTPQSYAGDDSQDDEEWIPSRETGEPKKAAKRASSSSSSSTSSGATPAKRRPYERGGAEHEKKSRKKEQNKNAATRYRQKKKQEVETILEEETRLLKTNKKLVAQFNEARREMRYLRNLLMDMYKQNDIHV